MTFENYVKLLNDMLAKHPDIKDLDVAIIDDNRQELQMIDQDPTPAYHDKYDMFDKPILYKEEWDERVEGKEQFQPNFIVLYQTWWNS